MTTLDEAIADLARRTSGPADMLMNKMVLEALNRDRINPDLLKFIIGNEFLMEKLCFRYEFMKELAPGWMKMKDDKAVAKIKQRLDKAFDLAARYWIARVVLRDGIDDAQPDYRSVISLGRAYWMALFNEKETDVTGYVIAMPKMMREPDQTARQWLDCAQAGIDLAEYRQILQEHVLEYLENGKWPAIRKPETLYRQPDKPAAGAPQGRQHLEAGAATGALDSELRGLLGRGGGAAADPTMAETGELMGRLMKMQDDGVPNAEIARRLLQDCGGDPAKIAKSAMILARMTNKDDADNPMRRLTEMAGTMNRLIEGGTPPDEVVRKALEQAGGTPEALETLAGLQQLKESMEGEGKPAGIGSLSSAAEIDELVGMLEGIGAADAGGTVSMTATGLAGSKQIEMSPAELLQRLKKASAMLKAGESKAAAEKVLIEGLEDDD